MNKIEIKYDQSKYMKNKFLNFFIDSLSINDIINKEYNNHTKGLVPPFLNLMDESEEDFVWDIFESDSKDIVILPILICSEDLDLCCIVLCVEVQKKKNSVQWLRFGYRADEGKLNENSILDKIPSFEFDRYEYEDAIRAFKWKRDTKIPQNILFDVVVESLFLHGEVTVYESYSEYDSELIVFKNQEELKLYLKKAIEKKLSYVMFKLYYSSMDGEVNIHKISLNPEACEGHTFRYEALAIGAIGLNLDCSKGANEISCKLYVNEPNRLFSHEKKDVNKWNWEETNKIYHALMEDLNYVKERYRAENLMIKDVNRELVELIESHGYRAKIVGQKIEPNFKEPVLLETWFYPIPKDKEMQSRLDIGVQFSNGKELYEAFSDIGETERDAINKNLTNFSRSSFHVFLDAFNETDKYVEKERWNISNALWDVFIGDYNIKKYSNLLIVEIPDTLFDTIESLIYQENLTEDWYFIRLYYAQMNNKMMACEFMINNQIIKEAQEKIAELDWIVSNEFYSLREFLILKMVKKFINN